MVKSQGYCALLDPVACLCEPDLLLVGKPAILLVML